MFKKAQIFLCCLMLVSAAIVVVLGAYTRLVDAGLGCPDWPTCYGHLWVPNSSEEIAQANQRFEGTPVETHKTWPEQIHRIFASSLGLVILSFYALMLHVQFKQHGMKKLNSITVLLTLLVGATIARVMFGHAIEWGVWLVVISYFANLIRCWRKSNHYSGTFILTALLSGLVILQGLFGMWTVTLKLWPQVVTAHLLGGFSTITLIALLGSKIAFPKFQLGLSQAWMKKWLIFACVVVFLQIALGGWTASNYAALACPDLPTCQNQWFPDANFKSGFNLLQSVGPNYLGGQLDNEARVAIHLTHRLGAILVSLVVGVMACMLIFKGGRTERRYGSLLALVLSLQIALGLSNVYFALPLTVAVMHNAVGACLLIWVVIALFNWRIRT